MAAVEQTHHAFTTNEAKDIVLDSEGKTHDYGTEPAHTLSKHGPDGDASSFSKKKFCYRTVRDILNSSAAQFVREKINNGIAITEFTITVKLSNNKWSTAKFFVNDDTSLFLQTCYMKDNAYDWVTITTQPFRMTYSAQEDSEFHLDQVIKGHQWVKEYKAVRWAKKRIIQIVKEHIKDNLQDETDNTELDNSEIREYFRDEIYALARYKRHPENNTAGETIEDLLGEKGCERVKNLLQDTKTTSSSVFIPPSSVTRSRTLDDIANQLQFTPARKVAPQL